EAQIPTEVLRQNPSRSAMHHEGGAGKAALPIPRRAVDRAQDSRRQSQNCRSAATSLEDVSGGEREVPKAAGCGLTAASIRSCPGGGRGLVPTRCRCFAAARRQF